MTTNRDLLKEAIADAKTVKETAIANAKAVLEEAFTPFLKEKLSAKIAEIEAEDDLTMEANSFSEMETDMDEEMSLDELLAELENSDDELYEAKEKEKDEKPKDAKEDDEMNIEDMSEEDLKSFIEDVIKDMVAAGELEANDNEDENMDGIDDMENMEDMEGMDNMEMGDLEGMENEESELDLDEDFNLNELLAELEKSNETEDLREEDYDQYVTAAQALYSALGVLGGVGAVALSVDEIRDAMKEKGKEFGSWLKSKLGSKPSANETEEAQVQELQNELNETNLLNAKLLYMNKIYRSKSLNETQKVKVLTSFDKATTVKEAKLVYETLISSIKPSSFKQPLKEHVGLASKALGNAKPKPIIENDAFSRMRELAFGAQNKNN